MSIDLKQPATKRKGRPAATSVTLPFTVAIDTREQHAFAFTGLRSDADKHYRPLIVPTTRATLHTGDYSILDTGTEHNYSDRITIERKSLADLFSTLGQNRARFERELDRMAELEWSAVVIEADWPTVLGCPPPHSQLRPKTIFRSVIAWQQRYPNVHWWLCAGREFAEVTTLRILERWWRDRAAKEKGEPGEPGEPTQQDTEGELCESN